MTPLTLQQICLATEGRLFGGHSSAQIQSICTDTRTIDPGCLFIALKGENHDGHNHVQAADEHGAIAALVDRVVETNLPLIVVADTCKAMGLLANDVRRQLKCTVIAVAGSNGKTGTKNLIHAALKNSRTGTISPKSFNNDIGVPTTIFAADAMQEYLVLEIGTNHPGEILNLTKIAEPDVAVITNIGAEHLEFLGDLDGVMAENAQIIAGLNPRGLLIINGDCDGLLPAVGGYPGEKITFGLAPNNDLCATDILCRPDGIRFHLAPTSKPFLKYPQEPDLVGDIPSEIFIPLMGRHTAVNALAAIAVARHLGVDDESILAGLATATGPEMRLQLQHAGSVRILNDAYNANPHSMQAGLETLRDMDSAGRRVAILGDMRELGETADRYHREAGHFAAGCRLDHLVCIGEKSRLIASAARENGMHPSRVEHFDKVGDCAGEIASIVTEGDLVLLKASRGMQLEIIAAAITTASAARALGREVSARTNRVIQSPPQTFITSAQTMKN